MPADDFTRVAGQLNGLMRRATPDAVKAVALEGVSIMKRKAPRASGRMGRSISTRVEAGGLRFVVGPNVPYTEAVVGGTGLYGPRKRRIVPTNKRALFWKGADHPVASVRGQRPNPFITESRDELRPVAEKAGIAVYAAALEKIG